MSNAPIVIPIRHDFLGATRFDRVHRRALEGRLNTAIFNARIDEINYITSDVAPSRCLALVPPISAIVFTILYVIVLVERTGKVEYTIDPELSIILLPFAVAVVQLLTWLWSRYQTKKLFTKIERRLKSFNRKDNSKGVLWRLNRRLPLDYLGNCSRVLCWSCYFTKLHCGIVVEFPSANQPAMTYAQGSHVISLSAIQPPVQTTHIHHSSQIGAGTRPDMCMATPTYEQEQSGSRSGTGPSRQQFAKPASLQPVFLPNQKLEDTNIFQHLKLPQPEHFSATEVFNQARTVVPPTAPSAPIGNFCPFDVLRVSASRYAAQRPNEPEVAPPVYKER